MTAASAAMHLIATHAGGCRRLSLCHATPYAGACRRVGLSADAGAYRRLDGAREPLPGDTGGIHQGLTHAGAYRRHDDGATHAGGLPATSTGADAPAQESIVPQRW